jgi:hypothetical protein
MVDDWIYRCEPRSPSSHSTMGFLSLGHFLLFGWWNEVRRRLTWNLRVESVLLSKDATAVDVGGKSVNSTSSISSSTTSISSSTPNDTSNNQQNTTFITLHTSASPLLSAFSLPRICSRSSTNATTIRHDQTSAFPVYNYSTAASSSLPVHHGRSRASTCPQAASPDPSKP